LRHVDFVEAGKQFVPVVVRGDANAETSVDLVDFAAEVLDSDLDHIAGWAHLDFGMSVKVNKDSRQITHYLL
jgi:hypothetical protein